MRRLEPPSAGFFDLLDRGTQTVSSVDRTLQTSQSAADRATSIAKQDPKRIVLTVGLVVAIGAGAWYFSQRR